MDRRRAALAAAIAALGDRPRARRMVRMRKPGQRHFTAAQRAEQSRKMKRYWAKRKAVASVR